MTGASKLAGVINRMPDTEPAEDYFEVTNKALPAKVRGLHVGLYDDGQKVPLSLYLTVNGFTMFQRDALPLFLSVHHTAETVEKAIKIITQTEIVWRTGGFTPRFDPESNVVEGPERYMRFPINPTLYNQENSVDWLRANANKYIVRAPFKNGVQDLQKAARNLVMYLKWLRGENLWDR